MTRPPVGRQWSGQHRHRNTVQDVVLRLQDGMCRLGNWINGVSPVLLDEGRFEDTSDEVGAAARRLRDTAPAGPQ